MWQIGFDKSHKPHLICYNSVKQPSRVSPSKMQRKPNSLIFNSAMTVNADGCANMPYIYVIHYEQCKGFNVIFRKVMKFQIMFCLP